MALFSSLRRSVALFLCPDLAPRAPREQVLFVRDRVTGYIVHPRVQVRVLFNGTVEAFRIDEEPMVKAGFVDLEVAKASALACRRANRPDLADHVLDGEGDHGVSQTCRGSALPFSQDQSAVGISSAVVISDGEV